MNDKMWNVGIIGLGSIGDYHMNNLSKIPDTRVAAICDVNVQAVEQVGSRLGLSAGKNTFSTRISLRIRKLILLYPGYPINSIMIF